jgi:hypothetical protein
MQPVLNSTENDLDTILRWLVSLNDAVTEIGKSSTRRSISLRTKDLQSQVINATIGMMQEMKI